MYNLNNDNEYDLECIIEDDESILKKGKHYTVKKWCGDMVQLVEVPSIWFVWRFKRL